LAGGASRLAIKVSVVKGQVEELANVCIDGKGPFPFLIDTGAEFSNVATQVAERLNLPHVGQPSVVYGIGCSLVSQPVTVASWSLGGVSLAPQVVVADNQPYFGVKGQPDGLLGSDVLSRFGAVRLDFTAQTLTLGGPEGPAPTSDSVVNGPTGPAPSSVLTQGKPGTAVPVTVMRSPIGAEMNVSLTFAKGPGLTFGVDTGTTKSLVSSSETKSQHLATTNLAQKDFSVCSLETDPLVHSGMWSIPGVALHPQLIESIPFDPASTGGIYGTLGSDQLYRFGWVVFDYTGGRLILG
jgi:predicted aspartyl protease